jgi:hypothetical protein
MNEPDDLLTTAELALILQPVSTFEKAPARRPGVLRRRRTGGQRSAACGHSPELVHK